MANNVTDLGKVGMTPKGAYNSATTYERLDVVTYEGSSYVSLVDSNTNNNPSTATNKWQLMAAHGEFTEAQLEEFKSAVVAESKEEMDDYTDDKKAELDTYEDTKETELNTYTGTKKTELDTYSNGLKSDFDDNASSKTTAFNDNATSKTTAFNTNATNKTTDFNDNASSKTTAFNTNASDKTTAFDNNASAKQTAFDSHVEDKTDEFDAHTEEMQQEIDELSANMPWNTPAQATEFNLTDAAKYSRNKLELFGNTSQKSYQGYNLVDVSPYQEETKNGVTLTKDSEGNIILNGTATSSFGWNVSLPQTKVLTAGTYTKSITKDSNIGAYLTVSIGYNGSSISGTSIQPSTGIGTMTLASDTTFDQVRMYIANNTTFNNYKLSYMILSGTYTTETIPDWEPFVGGVQAPSPNYPQGIHVVTGNNSVGVQGENLIFNNLTNQTINGVTFVVNPDKSVTINGTASATTQINLLTNTTGEADEITLPAGTYTLQGCPTGGAAATYKLDITNNGSAVITDYGNNTYSKTFTGSLVFDRVRIVIQNGTTVNNLTFKPMLVKGNTNVPYVPYVEPQNYAINLGSIELCKIGDYQDYLYKENGNWYKKNILNKYIFSGNENISKATDVFYTNDIANNILTSGIICLCNRMKAVTNTATGSSVPVNCCCFRPGDYSRFYFNLSSITTDINEIKQYLSNNNTYVIYPLAVPTTTQITDETLISQLDAIYEHLQLAKGINNITVTAEDLAPYMELTYMQDLKSKLDNLDSRLALLE